MNKLTRKISVIIAHAIPKNTLHLEYFDRKFEIQYYSLPGTLQQLSDLVASLDVKTNIIVLHDIPFNLELAGKRVPLDFLNQLKNQLVNAHLVDGSSIRQAIECWSIELLSQWQPGLFNQKHILLIPGLNHSGLEASLRKASPFIRYADLDLYFKLPKWCSRLAQFGIPILAQSMIDALKSNVNKVFCSGKLGLSVNKSLLRQLKWADIIVGDSHIIQHLSGLKNKIVIVEYADEESIKVFKKQGVSMVATLTPAVETSQHLRSAIKLGQFPVAVWEALMMASDVLSKSDMTSDKYLNILSELDWHTGIQVFQSKIFDINKFAFVIHPLSVKEIHQHPMFHWTRLLPHNIVEWCAAFMPPLFISHIKGIQSPVSGQKVDGYIYALSATPKQMISHKPRFTYSRINKISRQAQRRGAKILGLGAFTSVVGDAGETIAYESEIAVTSGNSLTVAAAIASAELGLKMMGHVNLKQCKAMVVGATGSIGAACSRLLAEDTGNVVLISRGQEKLILLKKQILKDNPNIKVEIGTSSFEYLPECDLIVCATSAFGQRVVDISGCKPGSVICDVARPHDINSQEAALRPDVLVIDSGEIKPPGNVNVGYNIGLDKGIVFACMAETALLAMEGINENYTIGRALDPKKVKYIWQLFRKHQFQLDRLRSFGVPVSDREIESKKRFANELIKNPDLQRATLEEVAKKLSLLTPVAKGVMAKSHNFRLQNRFNKLMFTLFRSRLRIQKTHDTKRTTSDGNSE